MLSNNGYVRGQYGVFGDKVYSGIKLNEYNLYNDEYTKHFLTTKEYVDSKFSKNTAFSVKSGYVHSMNGENNITQYAVGTPNPTFDNDGKIITINENFVVNDGYIIKSGDIYSIGFLNSVETGTETVTGHINDIIQLELGQQLYSELDNQIYTLISAPIGNNSTIIPILVPETITTTITNSNNNDVITFDKLLNDTIYHKLTVSFNLSNSSPTDSLTFTIPSLSSTNYEKYIGYMLKNNNEESVSKIISLSSYSGIVNNGINLLLVETSSTASTSDLECMIDENNIIKLKYTKGTQEDPGDKYTNNGSSLTITTGDYYLIDYYNKHVVKASLPLPTVQTQQIPIDDANIGTDNTYAKDLSLIAELSISKTLTSGSGSYTINIRALSSPDSQHITPWVIETPLILNTYKP